MRTWLERPHVAQWWDGLPSIDELVNEYVHGTNVQAHITSVDAQPIAFIQSYVAATAGDGWWEDITDPGTVGIDLFIGESEWLGRGAGTAIVRAFARRLFEDPRVTLLQIDPRPENTRAIRCFQRAGFHGDAIVQTPDGPARYLTMDRSQLTI